jgi:DNA-binding transcriptional LysR family regulator
LSDLSAFVAVANHKSFTRAADALGVSRSSLSHTLIALEKRMGQRLLHRTTRSVAPTNAGARLLERISPVLTQLDEAIDGFSDEQRRVSGMLRINASDTAARVLLSKTVPSFLSRYPEVEIELIVERGFVDMVKQGFDAGVRFAGAVPKDMIAVPFGEPVDFAVVASRRYLAKFGKPTSPDELHKHACIRQRMPSGRVYRWNFEKRGQEITVDVPGALTLNYNELMVEAAVAGLGIAYLPKRSAQPMLKAGRIVSLLEDWMPEAPQLCMYYSGHRHVPAALRAFIEIVKEKNSSVE